jgi:hypothetical protein
MPEPISDADVEIIPPHRFGKGDAKRDAADPLTQDPILTWLAGLMDSAFVIPGTTIRFGLDPIIGLIPIVGDVIAAGVSGFIVLRCGRLKMPRIVLARMSVNVILNALIGAIPFVGDIFSLWFRSNERNLDLARGYLANPHKATSREWLAVLGILAGIIGFGVLLVWMLAGLFGFIGKLFGIS